MKRFFPEMSDRPGKFMPAAAVGYWIFAFWFLPFWMPFIAEGLWENLQFASWLDIIYHAINAAVMVAMFKSYAEDSFFNVLMDVKKFVKVVLVAALVMLGLAFEMRTLAVPYAFDAYPIGEMAGIAITPGLLVESLPVAGTISHVLLTPIAVTGLFYIPCFAPMCCRKPWLGYLTVILALAIPSAFDILWRGAAELQIFLFLLNLPIHLIACWTYQKTDTVWAPLATLALFNLGASILALLPV